MGGEVLNLHIGQAGIQSGRDCWELFCLQHNIGADGILTVKDKDQFFSSFFKETRTGKRVPRALFFDCDSETINKVKKDTYRQIFEQEQFLLSRSGSAVTFARGYHKSGQQILNLSMERIRRVAQQSDRFCGFIVHNSVSGGTGSGLAALLLQSLDDFYGNKTKLGLPIFSGPSHSNTTVQPYNSLLMATRMINNMDVSIMMDNTSLYRICRQQLEIQNPKEDDVNQIRAQFISNLTASMRNDGAMHVQLQDFKQLLIPYPRMNSIIPAYGPFIPSYKSYLNQPSVFDLTMMAYDSDSAMLDVDPKNGYFMANSIVYRGYIIPKDVSCGIGTLKTKRTIRFVDWCPTGFRCGINYQPSQIYKTNNMFRPVRSMTMLANSSAIAKYYTRLKQQFNSMFTKKAFVHHFTSQGMQLDTMKQAEIEMSSLIQDYWQVEQPSEQIGEEG